MTARRWARWVLAAVPLVGLVELGALAFQRARAPGFDEWEGAAGSMRDLRKPGDVVVVAPAWAEPAARRGLGDEVFPIRDVARPDLSRYEHAIELSTLGAEAPELAGWREEERRSAGKFTLRRLTNPSPARVVYDFTDHVRPPFVDVRGTEPAVACNWNPRAVVAAGGLGGHPTFPAERFECPGGVYFNVGVTVIADEEFRARRCIWSHPFARGEVVTRFREVPLGQVIRGHAGMYWIIERELKGAPVTLTVRVDGDVVGSATHKDGDGWAAFEMPLGAHAGAEKATVEFAVTTTNYSNRHYCFEADTR